MSTRIVSDPYAYTAGVRSLAHRHLLFRCYAIAAVIGLTGAGSPARAATVYVAPDGTGDGTSWAAAASLTQALATAGSADAIWLAEGFYTNAATFSINGNRALYGGFTNGMATLDERDWEAYPTLLYGQAFTNQRVVAVTADTAETVILDGLVISNNVDTSGMGLHFLAGGLSKTGAGHLLLSNCRIVNHAGQRGTIGNGPGCHFSGGSVMITNCVFANISLYHDVNGGGIYALGTHVEIVDSVFGGSRSFSTSSRGGGIWFNNGTLRVWRTAFVDNEVGATTSGGGAVFLSNHANNRVTFSNCVFMGNSIKDTWNRGGDGGALSAIQHASVTSRFVYCTFMYNTNFAYSGTANKGGAVHLGGGTLELLNCKIAYNTCHAGRGGAVSVAGASSRLVLRNCTLAYNTSELGGGSMFVDSGRLDLINSISWSNSVKNSLHVDKGQDIAVGAGGTLNVEFSVVAGTQAPYLHSEGGAVVNLPWAMTNNPLFAGSTDLRLQSPAGRWHPDSGAFVTTDTAFSPAIDAGNPNDPVGLETTPHGNRINLGVYGGTSQASRSPAAVPQVARLLATNDYSRMVIGAMLTNAAPVIATVGICYGTTPISDPTTNGWDTVHVFYPPQQTGSVVSIMTPYLLTNTTYYYRAFATNGYGENWATVGSFVTDSDYPSGWGVGGGPDVIHVKHDATGEGTGVDWYNAFTQVADATPAAEGSRTHIWIAEGTYTEADTVMIPGSMVLLNGFSGTETNITQRDPDAHPVVIYGGGAERRVVTVTAGVATTVVLDSLVISNSFAGTLPTVYAAGGISKTGAGHLILSNCRIAGHLAQRHNGVGAHFTGGTVTITNCVFSSLSMYHDVRGGGIYSSGADLEIVDSLFAGTKSFSTATYGGGIWFNNGLLRVWRTDFINNTVGATSSGGGAVHLDNSVNNRVTFSNCVFKGNCLVDNWNRTGDGGAVRAIQHASVTSRFVNCSFMANTNFARSGTANKGGAVHLGGGTLELSNCKLVYNTCDMGQGGAVSSDGASSRLVLRNCTLAHNSAKTGGGAIYLLSGTVSLLNTILWTNRVVDGGITGYEMLCAGGDATVMYSLLTATNEPCVVVTGSGAVAFGDGILLDDPLFAGTTDFHLQSREGRWDPVMAEWVRDPLHSPAIDAGHPSAAIGNEPEPHGNRINMGAYGGTWQASKSFSRRGTVLMLR